MRNSENEWLVVKLALTVATATTVIVGAAVGLLRPLNSGSIGLTALLLLPALIYGIGVRSPRNIALFGAIVFGVTALTWGLYLINQKESMAGAGVVMGTIWALIASIVGAAIDSENTRRA